MGEQALRLLIKNLETKISSLDSWMYGWTALVILGCAGELYFVIHEHLEEHKEWLEARVTGRISLPNKPSLRTLILQILSVAAVVVGISGELYIDWRSGDLQGNLRKANGDLMLLLEQEAGDAKMSASGAALAAGKANGLASSADTRAATAGTKADLADGKADAVATKAAALTAELATASSQLVALEARRKELEAGLNDLAVCNAPRVIIDWIAHGKTYVDPLRPFAGSKVILEYVRDVEAIRAKKSLANTLTAAGWTVTEKPNDDLQDGVLVVSYLGDVTARDPRIPPVGDFVQADRAGRALLKFLHDRNWEAEIRQAFSDERDIPPSGLKILVGLYPAVSPIVSPGEQEVGSLRQRMEAALRPSHKISPQFEARLKTLPPQEAARLRAQQEEAFRTMDSEMQVYQQPCRSLTSLIP